MKAQCTKIEKYIGINPSAQPPTNSTRETKITELEAPISSTILKDDIKIKSNEFVLRDDQTKDIEDEEIV